MPSGSRAEYQQRHVSHSPGKRRPDFVSRCPRRRLVPSADCQSFYAKFSLAGVSFLRRHPTNFFPHLFSRIHEATQSSKFVADFMRSVSNLEAVQPLEAKKNCPILFRKVSSGTIASHVESIFKPVTQFHSHPFSDIKVSKIDVPRIWFHCCSPQNAENGSSLLRPFLSQKNQMLEEVSTQQQRDLNGMLQRYPLSAVRLWSQDMLFVDTPALLQDNMSVKIEQARKLLQDSPVIQSLQHHMEQQAQLVNEVLQEATSCSTWMIDDIMGEDALVAKARIGGVGIRPVLLEDVQHVCNIVSDSFEACAALHVYAAAAAVDRHNNTIEFTQQSESFAKMVSELKILRLELAKRAESITARDSEIELLRDQLERLAADFVSSQGLQLELQNAMTQNAALRDRIQKLEMRILEQPIKTHRQRPEVSQQIECLIYIAKVDFKGDGPHQLPLRKDDKVAVFVEDGLGWARGICNGRLGLFPSIICEKTSQVELVTLGGDHLSSLEGAFARTFSQSK